MSRRAFRRAARACALLLPLLLASCHKRPTQPPGWAPTPDSLGTPTTAAGAVAQTSDLAWSGATGEILYAGADFALHAVAPSSGATRTLYDGLSYDLRLSGDGQYAFYIRFFDVDNGLLVRQRVATPTDTVEIANPPSHFEVAASGDRAAYAIENTLAGVESLTVMRLSDRTRTPLGKGLPVAFAPDGIHLLARPAHDSTDATVQIDVGTLARVPFGYTLPDSARGDAVHWDAFGPRIVYSVPNPWTLRVLQVQSGIDAAVFATTDSVSAFRYAWSPDGTALAFSIDHLVFDATAPPHLESTLWVKAIPGGAAQTVVHGPAGGRVTWSPDGRRLAYVYGTKIYTHDAP